MPAILAQALLSGAGGRSRLEPLQTLLRFCSQVPLERLPEEDLALVLKELALDDSMRRQAETLNRSTRNR